MSLRQGNGQVYPGGEGGRLRFFGLWLQGVQEFFSKVHIIVALHSVYARVLTFEKFFSGCGYKECRKQ
jgi:hypothetical protein